jgi:hypothetical protein
MEEIDAPKKPLARRLANRMRLPRLSGKAAAGWLLLCLLLPAVLIPAVVRLPVWIDAEIVLGVWWLVWLMVLARLLYTGQRVTDDHALQSPRSWFGARQDNPPRRRSTSGGGRGWFNWMNWGWHVPSGDPEGCAIAILIVVGLILLVGGLWFIIEIAIPLVWFLLYLHLRGMLAMVINDRHRCRGRLGRSVAWAFVWGSAYTAPLALAVWLIHYFHTHRAGA